VGTATNLPCDPLTGKILPGPGRGRSKNKIPRLVRENIAAVFDELGGVDGMVKWARRSPRNLYAFYVYVYPRMLAAQPKMALVDSRPQITRIETVIIDPKADYKRDLDGVPIDREGAVDVEAILRKPVRLVERHDDDDEEREGLLPGEIPL
jgi:hypothetical protein